MNMLWSWIDSTALSITTLEIIAKLTLILGAVTAVALLSKVTASTKRLLWSAAIIVALLLPLTMVILPPINVPLGQTNTATNVLADIAVKAPAIDESNASNRSIVANNIGLEENAATSPIESQSRAPTSAPTSVPPRQLPIPSIILIGTVLWLVGALFLLANIWRQYKTTRAIKDNAESFVTQSANENEFTPVKPAGIPLLVSDDVATPLTVGIVKPVIILPQAACRWSADKLHCAVKHELAHVRGRDNLLRYCARVMCALYWFHPLVWYSARKLCEEQEKVADNAVLNQGVSPSVYAQNLLDIVKTLQGKTFDNPVGATMASYSFFPQRMRSILAESQNRQVLGLRKTALTVIAILSCALPVTLLTTQNSRAQQDSEQPARSIDFAQETIRDAAPSNTATAALQPFYDLDTQMTAAINKGDVDALVNFYTDDAVITTESDYRNEKYQGKKEIQNYWDTLVDTKITIRSQVEAVERDGDNAEVSTRYWASIDTGIGKLDDFFGGTTTTDWQLINGEWRIVNDLIHEPDYVAEEKVQQIVDNALSSIENIDWEEFGKSMATLGTEIAENFTKSFGNGDWDWNWDGNDWSGNKSSNNPLLNAVESGNPKSVKALLENGADANSKKAFGRSALYLACEKGNEEIVQLLLKHKADVNTASRYGKTPLYIAAEEGYLAIVKLLVKNKADVNHQTRYGRTALAAAAAEGHDEIVKYLLSQGAQVHI